MARIRTIKPEFFTSETIASLSIPARLTFIGLWTSADDHGRLVDNAKLIKGAIWPLDDDVTATDVSLHIHMLQGAGLVEQYEAEGRRYLHICGWREHQKINRPSEPKHPAPPSKRADNEPTQPTYPQDVNPHGTLTEGSSGERKGKERKGSLSRAVSEHGMSPPVDNHNHEREINRAHEALRHLAALLARQDQPRNPDAYRTSIITNATQLDDLEQLARDNPDLTPKQIAERHLAPTNGQRARCGGCGQEPHPGGIADCPSINPTWHLEEP